MSKSALHSSTISKKSFQNHMHLARLLFLNAKTFSAKENKQSFLIFYFPFKKIPGQLTLILLVLGCWHVFQVMFQNFPSPYRVCLEIFFFLQRNRSKIFRYTIGLLAERFLFVYSSISRKLILWSLISKVLIENW